MAVHIASYFGFCRSLQTRFQTAFRFSGCFQGRLKTAVSFCFVIPAQAGIFFRLQ
ncbi:hypothetical protein HMPREF9120_02501 [Neisseria sp. oral taxon 020 str. F0370]|nr:hypothetical protein HMPREF9120_02501 [Neisseria sp. oral taxon 020 str. F0370]